MDHVLFKVFQWLRGTSRSWVLFVLLLWQVFISRSSASTSERVSMSQSIQPLCDALAIPAVSTTYLWNTGRTPSILESAAGTPRTRASAQYLRTGIRTRPRWSYWQQFVDSIHQCLLDQKAIRVGILTLPSESGMVEYWQKELLRLSVGNKNYNNTIHLTTFLEEPDCDVDDMCNLDLLIDARSSGLQASNANVYSNVLVPEYETALYREKQSWIRRWLENSRAVMILLDPTIGNGLWQNMEYTRTLQLLADWYQIPFLSLAAHSSQQHHPWNLAQELVQYAVLDFTVLFCHGTTPQANQSLLLKPEAQHRAEHVLPPPLDTALSWQDVTRRWELAQLEGASRSDS